MNCEGWRNVKTLPQFLALKEVTNAEPSVETGHGEWIPRSVLEMLG